MGGVGQSGEPGAGRSRTARNVVTVLPGEATHGGARAHRGPPPSPAAKLLTGGASEA